MKVQIQVLRKSGNWSEAVLVDVLPRNARAPRKLIYRYYGLGAPAAAFLEIKVARLIFRLPSGSYYVLPDNPVGSKCWRFTNEVETG